MELRKRGHEKESGKQDLTIELMALPVHVYPIPALRNIFHVEGLVDVAHEMDDELGSLALAPGPQLGVEQLARVVLEGTDDAPLGLAIAHEVDAAVRGGVILGVDKVEVLAEAAPARVPDAVGPGGDAREVVRRVVTEQVLEVNRRALLHKGAGDVGDGYVAQACAVLSHA